MCFGSINPRIDHGADQDPPSRIIEIHSFSDLNTASTLSYEGTMSSSSKEKKKPFHNEESNLPSYPTKLYRDPGHRLSPEDEGCAEKELVS
ncbi:uncharacterized protein RAG0_08968 [Rhynchosporium agropyri]|uniref:Uncharacterized protein n=1 Tax=Rhynchosporium agropyri TaxID=914238 RepID=A0A1E1KT80_9HELO|nr:uncharacterized protein RAG0_08968 [Rhynchosporium agropyri]